MDDVPRRVNAAQLAARKIKTGTGARRRPVSHSSTVDLNAPPMWADPNATSTPSSGLFGGAISAAGSFDFSAPGPTVSFGTASVDEVPQFAPIPQEIVQNLEEKRKADAIAEELDRRNKPFQITATRTLPESSQPSNDTSIAAEEAERRNKPFQILPIATTTAHPESLQTSGNPFQNLPLPAQGASDEAGSTNSDPFLIRQSAPQSSSSGSSFNFGAPVIPTTSGLFSFSQTQNAQPAGSSFNFGLTTQEKPASIFSFGQGAAPQPVTTGVNGSSTPAPNSTTGIFSFGQASSQPSSSGINFNSVAAFAKPQNIFGQAQSGSSSGTNLNTMSAPTQSQSTFGKPSAQSSSSDINFNSTRGQPQPQPPTQQTNMFGRLNQQPLSANSMFSNIQSQTPTANNIFGALNQQQPSSSPFSLFGNQAQGVTATPAHTSFSGPDSTPNLISNPIQKPATTSSLFGAPAQQGGPVSSLFGNREATGSASQDGALEGQQQQQEKQQASSDSILGAPQPTNGLFATQQVVPASRTLTDQVAPVTAKGLFSIGAQQPSISSNLFGQLNSASQGIESQASDLPAPNNARVEPADTTTPEVPPSPKPSFSILQTSTPVSKLPVASFGDAAFSNGAQDSQRPDPTPRVGEPVGYLNSGPTSSSILKPKPDNIFSTRTTDMPEDDSRSVGEGTFPGLPKHGSSILKNNVFAIANAAKTSDSQSAPSLSNGDSAILQGEAAKSEDYDPEMGEVSDETIERFCPPHFNQRQRIQFFAAYRLRALNKGFLQSCDKLPPAADFGPSCRHYMKRREEILEACREDLKKFNEELVGMDGVDTNERSNKRPKLPGSADENPETDEGPRKRSKLLESAPLGQHLPKNPSPLKTQPVVSSDQSGQNFGLETHVQNKSVSPLEHFSLANSSTTPSGQLPSVFPLGNHSVAPVSPSPKGKRKAEVQLTQDDPTGERGGEADAPRKKMAKVDKSAGGSETSNIFRNIVDGPSQAPISLEKRPGSPEKRSGSPERRILSPKKPSDTGSSSRPNPFSSLPSSFEPTNSLTSSISPPKATSIPSSGADSTEARSVPKLASGEVPFNQSAPTGDPVLEKPVSTETSASLFASNMGTSGTGIFSTSIFAKKPTLNQGPLGSQHPSTSAASIFPAKPLPENALSNPFTRATMSSVFSPQPIAATPTNIFGAKSTPLTTTSAGSSSSSVTNAGVIKPPTFGNTPVNFLAQFGNKSQENLKDIEAKAMQKAKLDELDSDDDEKEWEAKWREKRAVEKKALEDLSKSKHAKFIPGKGFSFAPVESATDVSQPSETAQAIPKSIFSQQSSAPQTSNIFSSVNGSAASSPGAASSTTSSVFDHLPSSNPVTFGTSNIFGHLSDADSGADSGQGNDADDDNTEDGEDQSSASNEEQDDSEKNDKTYDPNTEEESRPNTPSTPPEETGPGIASAKKPASYLGAVSGTSTPTSTGSLFDRITKDSNGNPIRQIPTDDKENAEPSAANTYNSGGTSIFAKLGNSKSSGDNTWKLESPIKFSTSTPPSVSITAPTPTKTSPFTGLFSSATVPGSSSVTSTPASPFSGLFGNASTPKPPSLFANLSNSDSRPATVGFGFGATSTTASSLLPSVIGSTATSRATSPGGTTDGETASEAAHDPDAEHHEQINLAAGGPGEENEEVLFEVRAKAIKHTGEKEPKGSPWLTKGIGPLKVLKHKETNATRILLRADPSGTVVVNKGVLAQVNYGATGKTVKVLSASDDGKGLETWVLQVKTPGIAEELASVLESNRPDA